VTLALEVTELTKTYASGMQALRGIDLNVSEGDFFALLGPNGAGKSTTIGIIASLVNKTDGRVRVFGRDIDTHLSEAKRFLGVVPQEFNFNQFEKPLDILVNQAGYYGIPLSDARPRAEHYLRRLGLWEKRNIQARALSGGMKRRLMIARALVHEPRLLILDEPTAGVDIELRRSMWTFLRDINARGVTIILTTHYLEEAEQLCRHVAIIDHGRIVRNTSIKALLATLDEETFILDLAVPLAEGQTPGDARIRVVDPQQLEVTLPRGTAVNEIFAVLNAQGIQVQSLRNRANRLEELFVNLVERNLKETPDARP
jgi:ABC-2 type transport system ATP-binding protein